MKTLAFMLVCLLGGTVTALAAPPDFTVIASAGGVSPDFATRLVVIDSTGAGEFCRTDPVDRATGDCTVLEPVVLTSGELDSLWSAVSSNGFFLLPATFLDSTIGDGTYAQLTIAANSDTHTVMTQNMAAAGFDDIMVVLNSFLPPANQLFYNAIAP